MSNFTERHPETAQALAEQFFSHFKEHDLTDADVDTFCKGAQWCLSGGHPLTGQSYAFCQGYEFARGK